jgi:O-antigen biosynthesis protein
MRSAPVDPPLPPCSVVVPTRGGRPRLRETLRAVLVQSPAPAEVIVVESGGSTVEAAALCAELGITYLAEPRGGESRARNLGARHAEAEVVLFTDDDAIPEPGWLAALAAEFGQAEVGAAAGRVVAPPGPGEDEAMRIAAWMGLTRFGDDQPRMLTSRTAEWFQIANFGGIGIGPNMAFRRSLFDGWSGFDTRLGTGTPLRGGAEPYVFFSVLKRGHAVSYTPHARVAHPVPIPDLDVLRERQRHAFAAATGYLAFLAVTEPEHRWEVLLYLAGGIAGRRRAWRRGTPTLPPQRPSASERLRAYLVGVGMGVRAGRATPDPGGGAG